MTHGTNKPKYRRVILECDHELWCLPSQMPHSSERLWCKMCNEYKQAGPGEAKSGTVLEDGWISHKTRKGFVGECVWTGAPCGYSMEHNNWYKVRDDLDKHIIREHTLARFASTLIITTEPLHPDAPPPF